MPNYNIAVAPCVNDKATAENLRTLLRQAADELHKCNAWPTHPAGLDIRIVNPGPNNADSPDFENQATNMRSEFDLADLQDDEVAMRMHGTSMEIAVSSDLFRSEIGRRFVERGVNELDAAIYIFGHEIHHLDEPERLHACGIQIRSANSALAGAVRPDFPDVWKNAMGRLTACFPNSSKLPFHIARAGDIANEAAADLVGLHWLRTCGRPWEDFSRVLIDYRQWAANIGRVNNTPHYDIVEALESILKNGLPYPREAYAACWNMAVKSLVDSSSLPIAMRALLKNLPPLVLPQPKPIRQNPTSRR